MTPSRTCRYIKLSSRVARCPNAPPCETVRAVRADLLARITLGRHLRKAEAGVHAREECGPRFQLRFRPLLAFHASGAPPFLPSTTSTPSGTRA